MKKKDRISVDGGDSGSLNESPFDALDSGAFSAPAPTASKQPVPREPAESKTKTPNLGRVEVRRETSGRAGKAVTTIREFRVGTSKAVRADLLRGFKKKLAVGGYLRPDGGLEIQGDHREVVTAMLTEKGYRPVQAGG